ncbi:MAG: SAM-dependent methyltransferase [Candidatus Aenigmatarchaeota archaeon]
MWRKDDPVYKKAKAEGYRSRAAFKLKELNNSYHIIKEGNRVVDLGCAPGGWMQYTMEVIGAEGTLVGIDLQEIKPLPFPNAFFIKADINDPSVVQKIEELLHGRADVVLSDISPKLTGIRDRDMEEARRLWVSILNITKQILKRDGNFLMKAFYSDELKEFVEKIRSMFLFFKITRPDATRKASSEVYLVGKGFID